MTDPADFADRLVEMEVRIAHQDRIIEDLNAALVAQWRSIDALTRRLEGLADRVKEAETAARFSGAPEPPPPHY
ncbi:SlyX family protein [Siculibacillus lacustris]|uniref:Protein SlyX homolog n=1 Tax=Siculibacillus lacustris TaxID=1549641 RepID=A0A4Q9VLG1_9HYPH|nr:SlyX family protein [Siculibacillus lacustris]TBW36084.1 SlyX family protein [Siculibacillus lacustris]